MADLTNSTTVPTSVAPIYASFGRRLLASLLDGMIVAIPSFALSFVLTLLLGEQEAITVLLQMSISIIYYVLLTGLNGQTLGKMALGIKVVRVDNGNVPGIGKAILREILGKMINSFTFLIGYFWMLWDGKKQTIHDKIASTIVVRV